MRHLSVKSGWAGFLCCALATAAAAAPPPAKPASPAPKSPRPLDLSLPAKALAPGAGLAPHAPFAALHAPQSAEERGQLPALSSPAPARTLAPAEAFARRVHREGLPVARLWESHTMLLSLGLNPRGKPGLWFVQKVP